MILLLDAGNSRMKWACLVGGLLQSGDALQRTGSGPRDDVRLLSLAWAPLPRPDRVLVGSVLGQDFVGALSTCTMEAWQVAVESVVPRREAHGLVNAYAEPERLGVDRWLALLAARADGEGPVCVVDCGTAITVDAMRADGTHLGGLIMPGLELMRRTLVSDTQRIRVDVDTDGADETLLPWADDTRPAVLSGTLCAVVAGIDRAVAGLREPLGGEPRCYITGGDAERIRPLLEGTYLHRPELVLEGLALLADAERETG
jgi:type III pantothenate kinase